MNKIIIQHEQKSYHFIKSSFFNILSFANQLYQSKSIEPNGPQKRKIYFSKNKVSDFLIEDHKALSQNIYLYNQFIKKIKILYIIDDDKIIAAAMTLEIFSKRQKLEKNKKSVNKIFKSARQEAAITSDLSELFCKCKTFNLVVLYKILYN